MSISPVSPINDNETYVESQNKLNSRNTLESMDETDFPRNTLNRVFCCGGENDPKNLSRNTRGFMAAPGGAVQIIASSIAPDSGIDQVSHHTVGDKVGDEVNTKLTGALKIEASTTTTTAKPNVSPDAQTTESTVIESRTRNITAVGANKNLNLAISEKNNSPTSTSTVGAVTPTKAPTAAVEPKKVASSTTPTKNSSAGRISPSKSYDDMIKFVFTEHGIRVISDREYVV